MLLFEPHCSTWCFYPLSESRGRERCQAGWRLTSSAEGHDALVSTGLGFTFQEKVRNRNYRNWSLTLKKVLPTVGQAQGITDKTPTPGLLTRQTTGQFLPTPGCTLPASASSSLMRFLLRISALLLSSLSVLPREQGTLFSISFCTITPEAEQPDWLVWRSEECSCGVLAGVSTQQMIACETVKYLCVCWVYYIVRINYELLSHVW